MKVTTDEPVRGLMSKGVNTIEKNATVLDAAKYMTDLNIGSVVIVEEERLLGIVTEKDIIARVVAESKDAEKTTVGEIMNSPVITLSSLKSVSDAFAIMSDKGVEHLVVTEDERPIGMFSIKNFLDIERMRVGVEMSVD